MEALGQLLLWGIIIIGSGFIWLAFFGMCFIFAEWTSTVDTPKTKEN